MLNGQRQLWSTRLTSYVGGKKVGADYHRVCPSYKHFTAITNNSFIGISWSLLIPTLALIAGGVLVTLFVTWMIGIMMFALALLPYGWLISRYFDSTPYKWEEGSLINDAEDAFMLMPKAKQDEYRHYLDAMFKGHLAPKEAKALFEMNSDISSLKAKLTREIAEQKERQAIVADINKSLGVEVEG